VADTLTLPVRDLRVETPRTRIIRLALDDAAFSFRAGQAVHLGVHGAPLRKPYSIACSPEQAAKERALEFLVQVVGETESLHLADLRPGDLVDVEGPLGSFVFPEGAVPGHVLFVAGGTGISPLRAMLWHALLTAPSLRASLFYSARGPQEFAFGPELRRLAAAGRLRLRETVTREVAAGWSGHRGRITRQHLEPLIDGRDTLCFLCGPPALTEHAAALLLELGIPQDQIRTESWG
jgi:NAD(P)H-flavin reductase